MSPPLFSHFALIDQGYCTWQIKCQAIFSVQNISGWIAFHSWVNPETQNHLALWDSSKKNQYVRVWTSLYVLYCFCGVKGHACVQGRPWLTRGPVRGMEWGPPRSVCNGVTGGGGSIPFVAGRGARCDRTSCTAQRTALRVCLRQDKVLYWVYIEI